MKTWSSSSKFWNFKSFCSLHLLQASMFTSFSVCRQLVQTDFVLIGQVTLPLVTRVQVHRLQVIVKIWVSLELLEILKPWYQFSLLRCISGFSEDPSVSKSNRECLFWPPWTDCNTKLNLWCPQVSLIEIISMISLFVAIMWGSVSQLTVLIVYLQIHLIHDL